MLNNVLDSVHGVRASKQPRSLKRQRDLIEAGIRLLFNEDFEKLTISRIAAEAECSVGTFYSRFLDKEVYLVALQEYLYSQQIEEANSYLAPHNWQDSPTETVIESAIKFTVDTFRGKAEGVMRAALIQSARKPELWGTTRRSGVALVDAVVNLIKPRLSRPEGEAEIRLVMQLVFGMLINIILHDPGPWTLNDPNTADKLSEIAKKVLEV